MKKIVVAIPHSHTWFWSQTCVASLLRNPPVAEGYEIQMVVVDNSPWSPAIKGITDTWFGRSISLRKNPIYVAENTKANKFHASALDYVVERYDFDYLMALETDVLALRSTWLQWFVDQMRDTDFAVGHWHHENFVNPSCTLYRGSVLRVMAKWCRANPEPDLLRWGPNFDKTAPLDNNIGPEHVDALRDLRGWIAGPFADKRGWSEGTHLKEKPSGQEKGPGWYEPGQMLHHWAVDAGYTYVVCPTHTTNVNNVPVQTVYGPAWETKALTDQSDGRQLEWSELIGSCPKEYGDGSCGQTVHLWGGTRALDIIKHDVTCEFVKKCTPGWLAREARFWRAVVPADVQEQTLDLIRKFGWHYTGQGSDHVSQRDRDAAEFVRSCYREGGVEW